MNQFSRRTKPKRNMSRLAGLASIWLVGTITSSTYSQAPDPLASPDSRKQDLEEIAQHESYFAQELALMRLVDVASTDELNDMLDQSENLASTSFQNIVRSVAIRKLATNAPKKALERISDWDTEVRTPLVTVVYQEWSVLDLEAAIAFMHDLDEPYQKAALQGIWDSWEEFGSERLEEIALEFGLEPITKDLLADSLGRKPIEHPKKAWDELLRTFPDDLFEIEGSQLDFVAYVINANWERDGIKALRRLDKTLGDRPGRIRLMQAFLEHLADDNPEFALDVAIDLKRNKDDLMASVRLKLWAHEDPIAALHASLRTKNKDLRKDFVMAYNLASAPNAIPHLIIEELVGYSYEETSPILARTMHELSFENPELASKYLYLTEDHRTKLEMAEHIAETWFREDPRAAINWVKSDQEVKDIRDQLLKVVLKEMTYVDPEQAFQISLDQSIDSSTIGPEAAVIKELAKIKLDKAMDLLPQVRNSATMLSAASSVGRRAIELGQSSAIPEIASNLGGSNQSEFYRSLLHVWASDDPQGLYDSLEILPTSELKNSAAVSLYIKNEEGRGTTLNDEQRRIVESYLTEEHRVQLSEFAKKLKNLRYFIP